MTEQSRLARAFNNEAVADGLLGLRIKLGPGASTATADGEEGGGQYHVGDAGSTQLADHGRLRQFHFPYADYHPVTDDSPHRPLSGITCGKSAGGAILVGTDNAAEKISAI